MGFDPADVTLTAGLAPLTPDLISSLLGAARDHITRELTALGDDWACWRPVVGEWSANECLGHIIEADRRGFAGRIRRILATDRRRARAWPAMGNTRRFSHPER